ncbi:cytochrome P450 [Epithele typhae]|uniref:cytochrome P450 n=1 Tax=Epithele typhae TaxID=378194 RepID=UPI0020086C73|nr:cytochrome P450 [Epithele typhae]KAH9929493.1 cytochrome P450 [Epithele typhae]
MLERLIPPGPRAILANAHYLLGPPLLTYSAFRLLHSSAAVLSLPNWAISFACLLALPLAFTLQSAWFFFHMKRRAAAQGASIPIVAAMSKGRVNWKKTQDKYPRDVQFRLSAHYGHSFMMRPFNVFWLLIRGQFYTDEPEHIKTILATKFTNFEKGPVFREQLKSLLGSGVFNADGDLWKFHRSMTRPFFSKERITHFDIFDRHALDAIEQMKARCREGFSVDWQASLARFPRPPYDLASRFTMDSATEFLFGKDVCSLAVGLKYPPTSEKGQVQTIQADSDEFTIAFAEAQTAAADRSDFPGIWGLFEFWKDEVEARRDSIDKFINPIIEDALKRKSGADMDYGDKSAEEDTMLTQMVRTTDDAQLIHDETINILLAGRDTTANTLTFAVYSLAEHPNVLRRLRREILDVVGPTRRPTYDDIRSMKYLRAVINETLRLYPPVCVHTAVNDTVIPSSSLGGKGLFIPAGMPCVYSVFCMHRRKDLWGPDALSFDPDRFIDERLQKYLSPNPFIFLPFNAGPRICLGQQARFAYNETSFMLVRLLQQISAIEFTPEVAPGSRIPDGYNDSPGSDGTDRVWFGTHLTAFARGGLWIKVTEAETTATTEE